VAEGEGLLDLLVDLRVRVVQDPELVVDPQEDLMRLPLQRVDDVDEAVRHTGGQSLRLDLLDDLLHRRQRDLLQLLLHLLLGLLCLLVLLRVLLLAQLLAAELLLAQLLLLGLLLPELLAELLEQLLVGLLLAELLELLQRTAHAHAGRLLLAVALLLSVRLLLVRRRARELLALLLSHVTHLRGGAHTGVTFP
jgi:hypothetical protein